MGEKITGYDGETNDIVFVHLSEVKTLIAQLVEATIYLCNNLEDSDGN